MKPTSNIEHPTPNIQCDPPHPEIEHTMNQLAGICKAQRRYLDSKDSGYLRDLIAAAQDVAHHEDAFIRLAAQFNQGLAEMVLEQRGVR